MSIDHYHFSSIESTNTWSKANCKLFARDRITLITADEQTKGRGRYNREWISPPHTNLCATFCFFSSTAKEEHTYITQIVAVGACRALKQLGFRPMIKWPNDLLIGGKKVGGVLGETSVSAKEIICHIGLGININFSSELLRLCRPTTSLSQEAKEELDAEQVSTQIVKEVISSLQLFIQKGFEPFLEEFCLLITHQIGDTIRFQLPQGIVEGSFYGIDQKGALNLIVEGRQRSFVSGEIV